MKLFRKILLTLLIIGTIAMAQDEVIINEKFEDYSIAINDTLKSNVHLKIFVGDVNIAGVVYGKITVYGGDIVIDSTAVINGELKNFGGKVDKSNNTDVQGDIVEARIKGNYAKVPKFNFDRGHKHRIHIGDDKNNNISHTFSEKHPFIKYSPGFSFNRQEGFYLQIGDMQNGVGNLDGLDLGGTIGYAFGMKEWEANGIVRYNFMKNDNSTVYFNLYHDTKHFDNWRTADIDNFISYLFKKEDNYDRILVEGYKIGAQQIFGDFMKFKAEYISQSEDTIGLYENDTLGTYRPIATNINGLEFEPGKISGYRISNSISLGKDGMSFPGEMLLSGIYENYGGDWDFERLHLEVDYIATIANTIQNRTRVRASLITGQSNIDHPVQYEYWLGGIGSLRGIPFKSMQGNKSLLINQEVGIGLKDIWLFGFVDAGIVNSTVNNSISEISDYSYDNMRTTFGIGLETGDLYNWGVRFDVAKETSRNDAPWIWYFRLSRMF